MMKNLSMNVPQQAKSANLMAGVVDADQQALTGQGDGAISFQQELTNLVKGKKVKGLANAPELLTTDLLAGAQAKDKKKSLKAEDNVVSIDALLAGGVIPVTLQGAVLQDHRHDKVDLTKDEALIQVKGANGTHLVKDTADLKDLDLQSMNKALPQQDLKESSVKETSVDSITRLSPGALVDAASKTVANKGEIAQLVPATDSKEVDLKVADLNTAARLEQVNTKANLVETAKMEVSAVQQAPLTQPKQPQERVNLTPLTINSSDALRSAPESEAGLQVQLPVAATSREPLNLKGATQNSPQPILSKDAVLAGLMPTSLLQQAQVIPQAPLQSLMKADSSVKVDQVIAPAISRAQPLQGSLGVATPVNSGLQNEALNNLSAVQTTSAAHQSRQTIAVDEPYVLTDKGLSEGKTLEQSQAKALEGGVKLERAETQTMQVAQANVAAQTSLLNALNPIVETGVGSSNVISAYPGRANWNEAIGQKVMWMIGTQDQTASLTLNPPDMGPLQVIVNVNNNMVDATFISDNLEVRQALENGMLELRDSMSQSGIVLDQVNIGTSGNPAQSFRQEAQAQNGQAPRMSEAATGQGDEEQASAKAPVRIAQGLVDIFA